MNELNPFNEDLVAVFDPEDPPFEKDERYRRRLGELLPEFPAQVVAAWFVRHGPSAFSEHGWLDYRRFRFHLDELPTDVLTREAMTSNEPAIESWATMIWTRKGFQQSLLGSFMFDNGTWPVPPVVLNNAGGLVTPKGEQLGALHLLEGHHRLAFLKGLSSSPALATRRCHEVWKVLYK